MKNRTIAITSGAVATALVAGGLAWTLGTTSVHVVTDDTSRTVHTFGDTVSSALSSDDITLGPHDQVSPSVDSKVSDDSVVTVNFGRPLTIVLDGKKQTHWVNTNSLDKALTSLGISSDVQISANRSDKIPREGLEVTATSPKDVTIVVGGVPRKAVSTASTVGDLLTEQNVRVASTDAVSPAEYSPVTQGMTVKVARKSIRTLSLQGTLTHQVITQADPNMDAGQQKVVTAGSDGVIDLSWRLTVVDGTVVKKELLSQKVTRKQVDEVIAVGTRVDTAAASASGSASAQAAASAASAGAAGAAASAGAGGASGTSTTSANGHALDTSREAMWDKIAQCESSGNWSINTGNGYYGGLQFNIPTWQSVNGTDFAARPDQATKAEQITVANRLYAQRGLQPWECGWAANS